MNLGARYAANKVRMRLKIHELAYLLAGILRMGILRVLGKMHNPIPGVGARAAGKRRLPHPAKNAGFAMTGGGNQRTLAGSKEHCLTDA